MSKILFKGEIPGEGVFSLVQHVATYEKFIKFHFDTPDGFRKTLFIYEGKIIRTSSDQYDDRLGEIMYQEGHLSINALVDIAGWLSKHKRLGEILIEKKWYSHQEIFSFLQRQTQLILESLCFFNFLIFQAEVWEDPILIPHYPLHFQSSQAEALIQEAQIVKRFHSYCLKEPLILIEGLATDQLNDFWRDTLEIIEQKQNYQEICKSLRFHGLYSGRFLYALYRTGFIKDSWNFASQEIGALSQKFLKHLDNLSFVIQELFRLSGDQFPILLKSEKDFILNTFSLPEGAEEDGSLLGNRFLRLILPPHVNGTSLIAGGEKRFSQKKIMGYLMDLILMLFNIAQDLKADKQQLNKLKKLMIEYEVKL